MRRQEVKSLWKSGGRAQGGVVSQGGWREGGCPGRGPPGVVRAGPRYPPRGAGDEHKQVNTLSKFVEEEHDSRW